MANEALVIRYGDAKHTKFLNALEARRIAAERAVTARSDKWRAAEEQFIAYKPETDKDAERRQTRDVKGKPQFTTLYVPYSYAMLMAAHTYWTSVFMSRSPVFQFTGRHGETEEKVLSVEALMDYQLQVGMMLPVLYNWLYDTPKYGVGIVGVYWDEEIAPITTYEMKPKTYLGIPVPGTERKVRSTKNIRGYQGNKIFNIRPYDFLFDPRVTIGQFQSGEFCGYKFKLGWNTIVERMLSGDYFNIDVLKKMRGRGRAYDSFEQPSAQLLTPENLDYSTTDLSTTDIKDMGEFDAVEMVVELIPEAWGLGPVKRPEKWIFTWIEKRLIIGARPLGAYHNKYPYAVLEYEFGAYELYKRSMLEVVTPLQNVLDWLINTHMFNIRKNLNNEVVIDPSRVVMQDARDPEAGKLIRLRPAAYGTNPRDAIFELAKSNPTQAHLQDTALVIDWMQRALGVNDNIMGQLNPQSRRSATEVRSSTTFGINRLKTSAEWFSSTGWSPMSAMMLQNTQQYYDGEQQFRIAGDLLRGQLAFTNVTPEAIQGFYDFVPVDGTLPIDRFAQASLWREFILGAAKIPQILQTYDIAGIFGWAAQLAGLKNVDRFKIQVMPDQALQRQAQAGNVVPVQPPGGGNAPPPAMRMGNSGTPQPMQTPQLGPVA